MQEFTEWVEFSAIGWMAGLAAYMLAEKLLPGGRTLSRAAGVFLIAAGVGVLASSLVA